jgi:tartrate-resistant acid phosphatase type 5
MVKCARPALLCVITAVALAAQTYHTYVGALDANSVLLAWGTTNGKNTIGQSSPSLGEATVKIDGRTLASRANWIVVAGLKPETDYPYEVTLAGKVIGQGMVHTWPEKSNRLVFFVVGDYGTGGRAQYDIAAEMWKEFERRANSGNPVRFVITTGDNIYGDISTFLFGLKDTGDEDTDWERKFFDPYKQLLARIPFYPSLGNHDGNETEDRGDLNAYLDNFFFPSGKPARWYTFTYGGDFAEFFALDTTMNTESGAPRAAYLENGEQFQWLQKVLPSSRALWKIPYFHNPPFNAGPRHAAGYRDLLHWIRLFQRAGVKVAFNGHEHNFQYSNANAESGGVRFVISGAGGQLRGGNVQNRLKQANIAGWSPEHHFLVVEIDGKQMRITPIGNQEIVVRNAAGQVARMPLVVELP